MQGEIKKEKEKEKKRYLTQEGHLCKFGEKERRYIRVYTHTIRTRVTTPPAGVGRVNSDCSIPLHFSQSLHPD